ncbi:MAG: hypothetical protein J6U26_03350, partial [Lachnospiraceae bacterium]|nr:hypothetical protein [Lachnospiraceae bacterium]
MELIRMKCPSCDANLEVDSEREFFFCSYCGCRIMVHDTDMVNARVRIKEMEHEERMQQNEHEQERYMAASKSWLEKRREAKAEATRLALEERRLALEEQEKKQQLEREKTQQIMEA